MKIKTYQKQVEQILKDKPRSRDNAVLLYYYVLQALNFDPKTLTTDELLTMMNSSVLPHWESISRCSRVLQEKNPELAGKKRIARLAHQDDVKNELGYKEHSP